MTKPSKAAQDQIVEQLVDGIETSSEEEFDDLYKELDADHQMEVRAYIREFADTAVGDPNWDSDETGGFASDETDGENG